MNNTEIVIIGAGPIGLAMAARLLHKNIPFVLLEKGPTVGHNMLDWGHVNMFTSWAETIDPFTHDLLKQIGIDLTIKKNCPSGKTFVIDYLVEVAALIPTEKLKLNAEVVLIDYHQASKVFDIVYRTNNRSINITSKIVLDASGTWGNFNPIISDSNYCSDKIHSIIPNSNFIKNLPEKSRIAVVGSGHSAMNSLLEMSSHSQHELCWLVRSRELNFSKSKVGGRSESLEHLVRNLIRNNRIELTTNFSIESIIQHKASLIIQSENHEEPKVVSHLISNIGCYPNYALIKGFTLNIVMPHLAPLKLLTKIDPSLHSCDTVSFEFKDTLVTDIKYYVIGMKSFGKASNFLLSKGYKVLDELLNYLNV